MYDLVRSLLFLLPPEASHDFTLNALKFLYQMRVQPTYNMNQKVTCMGLTFPNRVGLAAGLDKNGLALRAWPHLGFGFVEVGTVTPKPQVGNPKPRLFRLVEDKAIINRMGFNNKGIDFLIEQIKANPLHCPLGVNIGKNKDTPIENAVDDYLLCLERAYPYADYITVNISSPNTPDLRTLQNKDHLKTLIEPLKNLQQRLTNNLQKKVPLVVKLSPDLNPDQLQETVEVLIECEIEGIIATNTTIERSPALKSNTKNQAGGLSGAPLTQTSTEIIRQIYQQTHGKIPIIAVGGIMDVKDAKAKFDQGASLVQLYTGFIYKGPQLISEIIVSSRAPYLSS